MSELDPQKLLLQTMQDYATEMRGMRQDFKDLSSSLASVQTLTKEIATTRHAIGDELGGMITQARMDAEKLSRRLSGVEIELAQKRGREEVLQWLAGGSSIAGLVSVASIVWRVLQ